MPIIDNNKGYTSELVKIAKQNLIAIGYQKLAVTGTVANLTVPSDARYALIVVESDATGTAIRYLETATQPLVTSSNGIPRGNLDAFDVQGYQNLTNFRVIQTQSGIHNLNVQYYK